MNKSIYLLALSIVLFSVRILKQKKRQLNDNLISVTTDQFKSSAMEIANQRQNKLRIKIRSATE
jgi:cobalt-zinc-cadmium efflux system membrane fusion protein